MAVADLVTSPFVPNVPGHQWVKVGYLDMTDPAEQCPDFLAKGNYITNCKLDHRVERKSDGILIPYCDSVNIPTNGAMQLPKGLREVPWLSSGIA